LAFTAARDGPNTDLYVYDQKNNEIERLTSESENVAIMGWSPDSAWIVYQLSDIYDYFGPEPKSIHAYNLKTQRNKRLYLSEDDYILVGHETIAGWLSPSALLVFKQNFEDAPSNIREIDLITAKVKVLFPGRFYDMDLDKKTGTIFLDNVSMYGGNTFAGVEGVYKLKTGIQTQLLLQVPDELFFDSRWEESLDSMVVRIGSNVIPSTEFQNVILTRNGDVIREIIGRCFFSPDGQFYILNDNDGTRLFTIEGELIKDLSEYGVSDWLRDSNDFYGRKGEALYFFQEEDEWQEILVIDDYYDYYVEYP
jgi:hypothetical protein